MSQFDDYIDGHSARVARLVCAIFPKSIEVTVMALTHDDGEAGTSDLPAHVKAKMPEDVREWWDAQEDAAAAYVWNDAGGVDYDVPELRLCDILDRLMYVQHKAPHLLPGEFAGDIAKVEALAISLNVADAVAPVLQGMRG
jgi:hypothetical protein